MNLNEKDLERFVDTLGFNFQIIFDWLDHKEKKSDKLDDFIRDQIQIMKTDIEDNIFMNNVQLKEKILGTEKIENLYFTREELDFLQKNNIIIKNKYNKNAWHDRLVEKAVEELRLQK